MSNAAIAAQLTEALEAAADREAGAQTALVSVEITMVAPASAGAVDVRLTRKTRTLVFMSAEFTSESGARIASAASVHRAVA